MCVASCIYEFEFNLKGKAAIWLPPFKEILDIVKSSGDLTLNDNKVLESNITNSKYYKELYKTIQNLEEDSFYIVSIWFFYLGRAYTCCLF
jgi:uncharacterized membrane-anchored protein YitT (DUF2179 family)